MVDIYLVDYLGIHCGMHYYLEAFKKELSTIPESNVRILSNYTNCEDDTPFFINQYKGPKLKKGFSLLLNLLYLKRFVRRHPDGVFIYLTYGNPIDLIFMRIISRLKFHLIDIHEAIAQNADTKESLRARFKSLYCNKINAVISHSMRTDDFLQEYGYMATRLSVPHFRYVFPKKYDLAQIPSEIVSAPKKDKINLLFFGNLNESKGIDILLEAVNCLSSTDASMLNLIIAGKDFDGAIDRVTPKSDRLVKIFKRHISDDELRYLYQSVDYICLPYRKTSQSGILEMAFYFKRPIIASDVPYFRRMLVEFPSFGVLAGNSAESYAETLSRIVSLHAVNQFYTAADYDRYENRAEIKQFLLAFQKWLHTR